MSHTRTWARSAVLAMLLLTSCSGGGGPPDTAPSSSARRSLAASLDAGIASNEDRYRDVRAVVLTVRGKTEVERYYNSSAAATGDVASVTKSVMSTLVGIALQEGKLRSVDQTLQDLLPSHASAMSEQVARITLRRLLTMTSGLPPDDPSGPLPMKRDLVRRTLTKGVTQPAGDWVYASEGSHLLAAVLAAATGGSVLDFAREKLFDPLGIQTRPALQVLYDEANMAAYDRTGFAWLTDREGIHLGGSTLKLTALDMAKIGNLYLNEGRWGDRQVIPKDWVREATRAHASTGMSSSVGPLDYGYQWWVTDIDGHPTYAASGFGGQHIQVTPDLGLVAVFAANINDQSSLDMDAWLELSKWVLFPAVAK